MQNQWIYGVLQKQAGIIIPARSKYNPIDKLTIENVVNKQESIAFVWHKIVDEVAVVIKDEPMLANFLQTTVLDHRNMGESLGFHLASKLSNRAIPFATLLPLFNEIFASEQVLYAASRDIQATVDRDSACSVYSTPFLYFKGFFALQAYRITHQLWHRGNQSLALMLQHSISTHFAVDIHPAAKIGSGILIDHATGLVIGETAVVEDSVSIMQSVTLGGTGKESGDRHPKIRKNVLLGPGAKVLGNIEVAEGSMVAASSVVLKSVPAHSIIAGVPAEVVGKADVDKPSKVMNHYFKS
ncbi:serine O-acetyltransferase [Porticoccaceae bacterium]|nr:serine O-acetyltransferase [Porticoccaceae bacterium]